MKDYLAAIIQSSQHRTSGIVATVLSLIVTFYSASNLFLNLDDAINSIWKLQSRRSFLKNLILTRIVAFFSVFIFGCLLLGWLGLDSALTFLAREQPGVRGWEFVSYGASILFFTAGFSITLHTLPRNHLTLKDAVPGAFITALAFSTSKILLTYYFAGAFGVYKAAGGVVVLLLWMYYSTMIYFIGVEITYAYSHRYGSKKNQPAELSSLEIPASDARSRPPRSRRPPKPSAPQAVRVEYRELAQWNARSGNSPPPTFKLRAPNRLHRTKLCP